MEKLKRTRRSTYKEVERKWTRFDYLIFLGVIILSATSFRVYQEWDIYFNRESTQGTIIKNIPVKIWGEKFIYYPQVEFTLIDDERFKNTISFISSYGIFSLDLISKNEKVKVYYDKNNPHVADIDIIGAKDLQLSLVIFLYMMGFYLIYRGSMGFKLKKSIQKLFS